MALPSLEVPRSRVRGAQPRTSSASTSRSESAAVAMQRRLDGLRERLQDESLGNSFVRFSALRRGLPEPAVHSPAAFCRQTSRSASAEPVSAGPAPSAQSQRIPRRAASSSARGSPSTFFPEAATSTAPSIEELRERAARAASNGTYGGIQGSQVFRAAFEAALKAGRLSITVADLVEAVLAAGIDSLPDAIGAVRMAWLNGGFRVYCETPQVFQQEFFACGLEKTEVWNAVMVLREVSVSPLCHKLSWELLQAVLQCLHREHVRPCLDIVVEVCRGAFGLQCDHWDVIAAAALAPAGACCLESMPWTDVGDGLASTCVVLRQPAGSAERKVFPPYSPAFEEAVEDEFLNEDSRMQEIEAWLQEARSRAEAGGMELTVPMVLALVGFQQACTPAVSGGAVLWIWEKMCSSAAAQQEDGESEEGASSSESEAGAKAEVTAAEEEMTPLEAFISCFYEDLRSSRPLFLSQLNNLYRMRSGGHDINYRAHGYARMGEFLAGVPGVELVGAGNLMAVQTRDAAQLAELAMQVTWKLQRRIAELRLRGVDTSALEITYRRPQAVPKKILARVWEIFQHAKDQEIPVNMFVSRYKLRYPHDKLRFKSLGYQDLRGLMAHVPFIEKVGGRRHSKYVLKADAKPPEGYRPAAEAAQPPRAHLQPGVLPPSSGSTLSMWLTRHMELPKTAYRGPSGSAPTHQQVFTGPCPGLYGPPGRGQ